MNNPFRTALFTIALHALSAAPAQQIVKATLGTSNSTFLLGNTQALRTQCLYLPSDLANPVAGNITRLYYRYGTTAQNTGVTLGNLVIRMGLTNEVAFAGGNTYFTGLDQVLSAASFTIPPGTTGDWFPIDLQTPFAYNPNRTLIIEIEFATTTAQAFGTYGTTPNNGRKLYSGTTGTATGTTTSTTWQDMGFDLDGGTGIARVDASPVMVWPNPARESVTVRYESGPAGTIEAIGADGRMARAWPGTTTGMIGLDLTGLAPGSYVLRMRNGDHVRAVGVLMKE
jgi:hypothetical protein